MIDALTILDPTEQAGSALAELAARPANLTGCRLGILDNGKPNSDALLTQLASRLARVGLRTQGQVRKPNIGRLAPPEMLDILAASHDLVLTGVGDCAGCCSCTANDGIALERRGIPTLVVCTSEFLTAARIAATAAGIPDYPFIVVEHPLGSLTPNQLGHRADGAMEQASRLLGLSPLAPLTAARSGPTA